jgi:predicted house-cleaning noncanonical NTP pyrophosphatase (MazG superfamily)
MDELYIKLLEQTPVIIALGIGIYVLWKDKIDTKKEMQSERQSYINQTTELTNKHQEELKQLNEYIRSRDLETLEALQQVTEAVISIKAMLENKLRLLD